MATPKTMYRIPSIFMPGNSTTYSMSLVDAGWAVRFMAPDTRDVKGVWICNNSGTNGAYDVRVETVDANGKPTGTLYDANAVVTGVTAGGTNTWVNTTFATLPTTGMTAGTMYAVVAITTTGGSRTFQSYTSVVAFDPTPTAVLTTATAATRSSFTEQARSAPFLFLVMEDDTLLPVCPTPMGVPVTKQLYGTARAGNKFVLNTSVVVNGFWWSFANANTGSPSDLHVKLLDASNSVLIDRQITVAYLATGQYYTAFAACTPTTLTAGTYRLVLVQHNLTTGSTDRYNLLYCTFPGQIMTDWQYTSDANDNNWTDTSTDVLAGGLFVTDAPTVTSGGGGGMRLAGHGGLAA